MNKIFLLFITNLVLSVGVYQIYTSKDMKSKNTNLFFSSKYSVDNCNNNMSIKIKTFKVKKGWGFDILLNNQKYIHQPNIPAINGEIPFKTKKDALKIAELMKIKICNNIIPPTITIEEINNLISKN
jgi:hypothetical protein